QHAADHVIVPVDEPRGAVGSEGHVHRPVQLGLEPALAVTVEAGLARQAEPRAGPAGLVTALRRIGVVAATAGDEPEPEVEAEEGRAASPSPELVHVAYPSSSAARRAARGPSVPRSLAGFVVSCSMDTTRELGWSGGKPG